ncbi:uncharacterized protein K452DRAFT_291867 [Aplosporella prunicola CBS 121167]|uniref:Uncharacterized protein n=1 Tax=Aplosporella prunicola CBS 121167 TaxID=1176127 RepID=A0A6A6B0K8_9PEZI|nr:uncharacterized protein K452DRAFT_291867 [Aplosporella prunicola CBS 121167]KAF2137088.1 hypothetical protein K452DRAFT_291867 [Aplosporella prunicola CBS 121167]
MPQLQSSDTQSHPAPPARKERREQERAGREKADQPEIDKAQATCGTTWGLSGAGA